MSTFKTKDYSKPESVKTVYRDGKKQFEENIIKSMRNLFNLKKEKGGIKDRIIIGIRTLFKQEDDYCNFWNNNYIEYENNGDRNKDLSVKEYLYKIKP